MNHNEDAATPAEEIHQVIVENARQFLEQDLTRERAMRRELQQRVGDLSSELASVKEQNVSLIQTLANLSTLLQPAPHWVTENDGISPPKKGY